MPRSSRLAQQTPFDLSRRAVIACGHRWTLARGLSLEILPGGVA